MRKRDCFCQSFDLWDTYLIKIQASLVIILTEWKYTQGPLRNYYEPRNGFYFVFKLPFLDMQNIFLEIFLLLSSSLSTVFNEKFKKLIPILQRKLRKSGKSYSRIVIKDKPSVCLWLIWMAKCFCFCFSSWPTLVLIVWNAQIFLVNSTIHFML